MQVGCLEWRVEADLSHGYGGVFAFVRWGVAWAGDQVFAF
jgi:hypothetical protein